MNETEHKDYMRGLEAHQEAEEPEQDPPIKMLPVLFENGPRRQAFEAWWRRTNATPLYMNEGGTYTRSVADEAWEAWKACSNGVEGVVDALMLALPYVEDAQRDLAYKPGVVKRMVGQMKAALAQWDAVALKDVEQPLVAGEHDEVTGARANPARALV